MNQIARSNPHVLSDVLYWRFFRLINHRRNGWSGAPERGLFPFRKISSRSRDLAVHWFFLHVWDCPALIYGTEFWDRPEPSICLVPKWRPVLQLRAALNFFQSTGVQGRRGVKHRRHDRARGVIWSGRKPRKTSAKGGDLGWSVSRWGTVLMDYMGVKQLYKWLAFPSTVD